MQAEKPITPKLSDGELVSYAWDYFLAHGQARLTTFRFYLIFCTILCSGICMILAAGKSPLLASPLSLILAFLSFVYWKVDVRHKDLIKNARAALVSCESSWGLPTVENAPHPLCLFTRDAMAKAKTPANPSAKKPTFTYSTCVGLVFFVFGVGGLVSGSAFILWHFI